MPTSQALEHQPTSAEEVAQTPGVGMGPGWLGGMPQAASTPVCSVGQLEQEHRGIKRPLAFSLSVDFNSTDITSSGETPKKRKLSSLETAAVSGMSHSQDSGCEKGDSESQQQPEATQRDIDPLLPTDIPEVGDTTDGSERAGEQLEQSAAEGEPRPPPPPPGEDVQTVIRRITTETRELFAKWQEPFSESEAFESFCPSRIDELLKEARALEENMMEQKERLKQRLKLISSTLEMI